MLATCAVVAEGGASAGRVTFARSADETRWGHRPGGGAPSSSFLQEPTVTDPRGWRTWQPNGDTKAGMTDEEKLQRNMFKGLTDLNNMQLNPLKIRAPDSDKATNKDEDLQARFAKGVDPKDGRRIDEDHPQGREVLKWRQQPHVAGDSEPLSYLAHSLKISTDSSISIRSEQIALFVSAP